jgi:hypothetical protein
MRYGWITRLDAYCFTALLGVAPEAVAIRLGADPATATRRTFDECFWTVDDPQYAQLAETEGGVILAEHNGWRAEEEAEALSRGGRLACFYRNVDAVMRFVYAVDGHVLAAFDPLLDRRPKEGADPDVLDPWLRGLPFGLHAAEPSAMTLLERATGVRVTLSWLNRRQPAVQLPPLR